ncbi:hypothetical protein [Halalkalibacterium ligniniphilum]|uniref:hypothetical protein n=1 Tax=Halalkalibacterium ligniniphilum TaxID=1134413 RepID=UPI0003704BC6|nr:hypothetical protein [Halalkalibacterium ligniniphilum]
MTFVEMFASLKSIYKQMMFPKNPYAPKWALSEIDQMDVHFFYELMNDVDGQSPGNQEVYLSDVW